MRKIIKLTIYKHDIENIRKYEIHLFLFHKIENFHIIFFHDESSCMKFESNVITIIIIL